MPQALPYVMAAQGVVSLINQLNPPKPPSSPQIPTVSYDEAVQRAQEALNPIYQQALQETLRDVQQDAMRRGFFGQLPGAALSQDAAARLEAGRSSAVANLAQQMVGQSLDAALRQQALAQQYALAAMQSRQQAVPQFVQTGISLMETFPQLFTQPLLSAGRQALSGMTGLPTTGETTPATSTITPTYGNMGLANQALPYQLQMNFTPPQLRVGGGTSFINPYQ